MKLSVEIKSFSFWLDASGYAITTRNMYIWAIQLIEQCICDVDIAKIKPDDLERFWAWVRRDYIPTRMSGNKSPLSGRSLENIWTAERTFFRWALEKQRIKSRPDLGIKKPKYAPREIAPVDEGDLTKLLAAAKRKKSVNPAGRAPFSMPRATAKRDIAIIMVLAETGIRVSECARLERRDVDLERGTVTVQPFGTGRKTKFRALDIGRNTKSALFDYFVWREEREKRKLDPDERVFVTSSGASMDKDSIRQVIGGIAKTAGIARVHPHQFRHLFGSMMAADGASEFEIMMNLGQTSTKAARGYVHMHRVKRKKRVSVVDELTKKK